MARISSPLYRSAHLLKRCFLLALLYAMALAFMALSFLKLHPTFGHIEFYYTFLFLTFIYFKGPALWILIGLSILEDSFKSQVLGLTPLLYASLYIGWQGSQKIIGRLTFLKIWLFFTAGLLLFKLPLVLGMTASPYRFSQAVTLGYAFSLTAVLFPVLMRLLVPFIVTLREALYGPSRR